jgi:hypothetical protein
MSITDLLQQMVDHGGTIHLASDLSEEEIASAMADRRFASDPKGNGFVRRVARSEKKEPYRATPQHMPAT